MSDLGYNKKISSGTINIISNLKPIEIKIDTYKPTAPTSSRTSNNSNNSIDLDEFLSDNLDETIASTKIAESHIYETEEEENLWDWVCTGASTLAVGATSVLSGVLDIGEAVLDGGSWLVAKTAGVFSDDAESAIEEFIAVDLVGEANEAFYENTSVGQAINESSALKYDSEVAQGIRSVTEDVGVFAISTALTVCTGGAAAPLTLGLGFLHGVGGAAEDTYATYGTDTSTVQELLILGNGGLSALSWYANGKLGKGFIEIGKAMSEASVTEILSQMTKEIFSKDMLKELFKPSNIVGNAIATLMQSGGDIAKIATKLYNGGEVTEEEWSLLVGELIVYFGLNITEDALRTEITNFKTTPSPTDITEVTSEPINQNAAARTSTTVQTTPLQQMSINDLDDSAGEDLLKFSQRYFINRDFFYTEEGRRMYDIYQKLSNTPFDEFNARYPGLFNDEDDYFNALSMIERTKRQSIMNIIGNNESNISTEQFNDIQDYILDRGTYVNVFTEDIEYLRSRVDSGQFQLNPMYQDVYNQLCKKLDLAQAEDLIRQRLANFAGGYVSAKKTQSIIGSFELQVDSDFRKHAKSSWAGYNNGTKSMVNLNRPLQEIEEVMNHESIHQISFNDDIHFDAQTGARIDIGGVCRSTYIPGSDSWESTREGINESLTEYFNIISHGDGYVPAFISGYTPGVQALESFVDNGLISVEKLKELYFTNEGEALVQYFDDLSSTYGLTMKGSDVMEAFDNAALEDGDTIAGVRALNKYLKEYQKAVNRKSGFLSRIKGIFGS